MSAKKSDHVLLHKCRDQIVKYQGDNFMVMDGWLASTAPYKTWDMLMKNISRPEGTRYYRVPETEKVELVDPSKIEVTKAVREYMVSGVKLSGCSVGSDPELFVLDDKGTVIPAFTFLKSKQEENPYWDGFQAEFTTGEGAQKGNNCCVAYLTDEVADGIRKVAGKAHAFNKKSKLTWKSVVDIPFEMMEKAGERAELGCSPSLNVYPDTEQLKVEDPTRLLIRFAGCHMHFGLDRKYKSPENISRIVKSLDAVLGVALTSILETMEDPRRRMFYGRAGEHRLPAHGLEYRTPSSAILAHPVLFHFVMDLARFAKYIPISLGYDHSLVWSAKEEEVKKAINEYDVELARKILDDNKDALKYFITKRYSNRKLDDKKTELSTALYSILTEGARKMLPIDDMEKNWYVGSPWAGHSSNNDCCVATWKLDRRY